MAAVRDLGADVGFALDGDADRCIAVDAQGRLVDGDQVLGILALERLGRGVLEHGSLVVSVLSNGGLQHAVEAAGGRLVRTPVGDKHILAAMLVSGAGLGGEKSGHVIVREHALTGDGIVTALELLRVMRASDDGLDGLAVAIPLLPQQQRAIRVRHRDQWENDEHAPGGHRRRRAAARARRADPRPALRHRARAAGHGRGQRCRRRGGAGRRDRGARRGATTLAAHVRHRRLYRSPRGGPHPHRGPPPARVPGLRLRRDRPRRRAGRPVRGEEGRQARQPPDRDRGPDAARRAGPRPHPLGHARAAQRPQRPSPPGLHGRHHGDPQRDHRELPRAARRARGPGPRPDLRDRHRGDRPPRRGVVRGRPRRRGAGRAAARRGRLRAGRDAQGRDQPARRGPPERAAGRGPQRRGELHRERRRRDPRPHRPGRVPRGRRHRRRPADRRRDHRPRRHPAAARR